jgi:uncharacterized membrane protein
MTTEASMRMKSNLEAAESMEATRRNIERNAETAQREKEEAIANVYEMAGKIKATNFQKAQSNFFGLLMLKRVKDSKGYRDRLGMSWEKFCEHVGVNRRWVDEQLGDLKPFKVEFLEAFLQFSGVPINKVKYLAESVAEGNSAFSDNAIIYNGETIPLDAEHKDDIQALLENLETAKKKEKEELEAALSAQKKVAAAKEKVINNLERDLKRLEKTVVKSDLTEEEQDAINLLSRVQTDFLQGFADIRKKIKPTEAPEIVQRSFYFLIIFMSKICMDERMALEEAYRDAECVPWEIRDDEIPEPEVFADNLPTFVGTQVGKKYREKIKQRQEAATAKKAGNGKADEKSNPEG